MWSNERLSSVMEGLLTVDGHLCSGAFWSKKHWQDGRRLSILGAAFYLNDFMSYTYSDLEIFMRQCLWTLPLWQGYDLNTFNNDPNIRFEHVKLFLDYCKSVCTYLINHTGGI